MADRLEQIDGDKLFTGNVEILGEINNASLNKVVTDIEKAKVSTQTVKADLQKFLGDILADGKVDPTEKKIIAQKWGEITTEYPIVRARAIEAGIAEGGQEITAYESAYADLQTYLKGTPGILNDMKVTIAVDKAEMEFKFTAYYIARETINTQAFVTTFNEISETVSRVFYDQPVGPYKRGDLWVSDGILYQSNADRGAGEFYDTDWEWCIRSNLTTVIESTNGDVFKPGENTTTTLIPHCFRNGIDITDTLPDSAFKWTRVSRFPQSPPNDDDTWNFNHAAGYRTVEVTTDSIYARATYKVEILE